MTAQQQRLPVIDVLRGIALVAMAVFHFAWDLRFFNLIETDIIRHPFWMNFARTIAASFLILVGISLVLATHNGVNWQSALRRLAMVGGAALLITVVTYFATPESYIFFGILHCITLGSAIGLLVHRWPTAWIATGAAFVWVLPMFMALPVLDQPLLRWVGMGTTLPVTNDYNPLFPWLGFILTGMVIGRMMTARELPLKAPVLFDSKPMLMLAKAGRHSLLIYLTHQPILIALVAGLSLVLPQAGLDRDTINFRISCEDSCRKTGNTEAFCPRYCACAEDEIRKADLWKPMFSGSLDTNLTARINAITQQCTAASRD